MLFSNCSSTNRDYLTEVVKDCNRASIPTWALSQLMLHVPDNREQIRVWLMEFLIKDALEWYKTSKHVKSEDIEEARKYYTSKYGIKNELLNSAEVYFSVGLHCPICSKECFPFRSLFHHFQHSHPVWDPWSELALKDLSKFTTSLESDAVKNHKEFCLENSDLFEARADLKTYCKRCKQVYSSDLDAMRRHRDDHRCKYTFSVSVFKKPANRRHDEDLFYTCKEVEKNGGGYAKKPHSRLHRVIVDFSKVSPYLDSKNFIQCPSCLSRSKKEYMTGTPLEVSHSMSWWSLHFSKKCRSFKRQNM